MKQGTWKSYLLLTRPKTLPASLIPICIGALLAKLQEVQVELGVLVELLLTLIFLQLATNAFNDVLDNQKGADTQIRLGPKRMISTKLLTQKTVLTFALTLLGLSCLIGLHLIWSADYRIWIISIMSVYLVYGYTGGPFPLAYLGLGELFVILFFGIFAVAGSFYLFTGSWNVATIWMGTAIGLFSSILININNLRDVGEDQLSKKKTVVVRLGWRRVRFFPLVAFLIAYPLAGWSLLSLGISDLSYYVLFSLPAFFVGIYVVIKAILLKPSAKHNRLLAFSSLQLVLFLMGMACWIL